MGEIRLNALGVVQPAPDSPAVRSTNDYGHGIVAVGAVIHPCRLADDLVEGREYEVGELDLHHRAQPIHGRSDGHADHARFGQRGVYDSLGPELIQQTVGDPEHAAVHSDVLADQEHTGVCGQLFA